MNDRDLGRSNEGRVIAHLAARFGAAIAAAVFAAPAFAQQAAAGAAPPDALGGALAPMGMLVLMFVLMYFLIIRPQQKRQKDHQAMVMAVKRGDTVVLQNGMIGKVMRVEDAEVQVEIATNVNTQVIKSYIAEVRARATPAAKS
jgi:preprotein translocase subunit YajC